METVEVPSGSQSSHVPGLGGSGNVPSSCLMFQYEHNRAAQGINRAGIPPHGRLMGPWGRAHGPGARGQAPSRGHLGGRARPFPRETLRKNSTQKKGPSGLRKRFYLDTFLKNGTLNGPWAQTGSGAMGPNGPWVQTGPGLKTDLGPNGPWPKRALGPNGPWSNYMQVLWPYYSVVWPFYPLVWPSSNWLCSPRSRGSVPRQWCAQALRVILHHAAPQRGIFGPACIPM